MSTVDLHLVSWNRPKMTELVIRTIHRNTKRNNFRLVVLDNGSEPATRDRLQYLADNAFIDEIYQLDKNVGLEAARDFLLQKAASTEYFVCIDNDCLPPPKVDDKDWVDRMLDLMQKHEDYAAISMRTQVMIGTGNIFEAADATGADIVPFGHPGGSFRIMATKAVKQVGGWDRRAPGRGSEERYICSKLLEHGYRTGFAAQIRCLHLFGTRGDIPTDRWGYDKDLAPEATGHSDIDHPALRNGDDMEEVKLFAGDESANRYYQA